MIVLGLLQRRNKKEGGDGAERCVDREVDLSEATTEAIDKLVGVMRFVTMCG